MHTSNPTLALRSTPRLDWLWLRLWVDIIGRRTRSGSQSTEALRRGETPEGEYAQSVEFVELEDFGGATNRVLDSQMACENCGKYDWHWAM